MRSTFYRLAMIAGQGGLVYVAGELAESTGNVRLAWSLVFCLLAVVFGLAALYHRSALPRPAADRLSVAEGRHLWRDFTAVLAHSSSGQTSAAS